MQFTDGHSLCFSCCKFQWIVSLQVRELPSLDPWEATERGTHSGLPLISVGVEPVWVRQPCSTSHFTQLLWSSEWCGCYNLLHSQCVWAEIQSSHTTLEMTESVHLKFKKSIAFCMKFLQKPRWILISLERKWILIFLDLFQRWARRMLVSPMNKESIVSAKYFFQKQCTRKF